MDRNTKQFDMKSVSVALTLTRTVVLSLLTLLIIFIVRASPLLTTQINAIASTSTWTRLYGLLGIETALGREQCIMITVILSCFLLAVILHLASIMLYAVGKRHFQKRKATKAR